MFVLQVGMADIPFDKNPRTLSDGYKRRLALAVQLVIAFHFSISYNLITNDICVYCYYTRGVKVVVVMVFDFRL
jgi:hypothetical protein